MSEFEVQSGKIVFSNVDHGFPAVEAVVGKHWGVFCQPEALQDLVHVWHCWGCRAGRRRDRHDVGDVGGRRGWEWDNAII
jgi:hypothetical protein